MASAEDPQDPPAQPPTSPVEPVEPVKDTILQLKTPIAETKDPGLATTNEPPQQLIEKAAKQQPEVKQCQEPVAKQPEPAGKQAQHVAPSAEAKQPESKPAQAKQAEEIAVEQEQPTDAVQQQKPPPSPFVSKLRGEVDFARTSEWEKTPSVGTWLTPRGTKRMGENGNVVQFAEGSTPRSWRQGPTELKIKGSLTKAFKLEKIPSGISVWDVKALCERHCNLPPDCQRLLHKGKILQDSALLEELDLPTPLATLFLVKGAQPPASSSSASAGAEEEARKKREQEEEEERRREEDRPSFEDMDDAHLMSILMMGRPCWECGVNPGRLQTDGMCSVCFRELVMRENVILKEKKREEEQRRKEEEEVRLEEERRKEEEYESRQKDKTRCQQCNKKCGLTGFMCRCGFYYCATHRHAEDHECSFDHRAHGREINAKNNPGS